MPPSFTIPRGVAPEEASTPEMNPFVADQSVIAAGNEMRRNTRPTRAGLKRFCPRPPKVIFATPMATTAPMSTIHHGDVAGRFSASRTPVTAADQSQTVFFPLRRNLVMRYSRSMQETTLTPRIISSDHP